MARGKSKAARGSVSRGRGGSSRGRGGRVGRGGGRGGYQSYSSGYETPENGILSMVQAARETGSHDHKAWGSTSLRTQPVMFISAGNWDPKKDMDKNEERKNGERDAHDIDDRDDEAGDRQPVPLGYETDNATVAVLTASEDAEGRDQDQHATVVKDYAADAKLKDFSVEQAIETMVAGQAEVASSASPDSRQVGGSDVPSQELPQERQDSFGFFFDIDKRPNEHEAKPSLAKFEPEPEPLDEDVNTDSSDEVILFKGRVAAKRQQYAQLKSENLSMSKVEEEITAVESQLRPVVHSNPTRDRAERPTPDTLEVGTKRSRRQRKNGRESQGGRPRRKSVSSDDGLIADYIENMRATGEDQDLLALLQGTTRDLGGSDNAEVLFSEPCESDADAVSMDNSMLDDAATVSDPSGEEWPTYEAITAEKTERLNSNMSKKKSQRAKQPADMSAEQEVEDGILAQIMAQLGSEDANDDKEDGYEEDPAAWPVGTLDTFDTMDWERPSLQRRKGKGKNARLQLDLSDSELEHTLQAAWKTDRMKKAERKKQREEMRALGLLGRNASPEDLRVKYPSGMSIDQIGEELRIFLESSKEQLELPPMDKHARKMIHELANKFNIKSKSTGDGSNRRPTLYKCKRTLPYAERTFDQAMSRMHRKHFPRLDAKRRPTAPRTMGQGRVSHAAATVRDGEMVGAAAPELGIENRGRAMLEKMGWSSGTALGAMDNKGILQPVSHAMKRTKAGLA